jgi:uncharacterized membrane protein
VARCAGDILRGVQPKLKRSELDHLAKFYSLDEGRVESLLSLSAARPSRAETRRFAAFCLGIAGLLSLAAGVVFFVAANWSDIAALGRFALLEILLVACGVVAFVKPPPASAGRAALFLAFVTTGALLALFGQTYQTGADVYELFLGWTLLGLPLALIARWSLVSAAWILVLNLALMLYCGWQPAGGMLWALLGGSRFQPATLIMGAAWLNLLLWFAAEWRRPDAVPDWVRRLLVTCAFLFGTWAGVLSSLDDGLDYHGGTAGFSPAPLLLVLAMAATVAFSLRQREDVYPLAMVMASFIVVSMTWIADAIDHADEGVFLLLALYLIAVSTGGGRLLVLLMRRWRDPVPA